MRILATASHEVRANGRLPSLSTSGAATATVHDHRGGPAFPESLRAAFGRLAWMRAAWKADTHAKSRAGQVPIGGASRSTLIGDGRQKMGGYSPSLRSRQRACRKSRAGVATCPASFNSRRPQIQRQDSRPGLRAAAVLVPNRSRCERSPSISPPAPLSAGLRPAGLYPSLQIGQACEIQSDGEMT